MRFLPLIAAIVISWAGAFGIAWGVTEWREDPPASAPATYTVHNELLCQAAVDLRAALISGGDSLNNTGWVHFMEQAEAEISEFC